MDDLRFGKRNKRGDWAPSARIEIAPVLTLPMRPVAFLRWLPHYFLPWNSAVPGIGRRLLAFRRAAPGDHEDLELALGTAALCHQLRCGIPVLRRHRIAPLHPPGAERSILNTMASSRMTMPTAGLHVRQPDHREPGLDLRERRADLDRLRGADAMGLRERHHPMGQLQRAPRLSGRSSCS